MLPAWFYGWHNSGLTTVSFYAAGAGLVQAFPAVHLETVGDVAVSEQFFASTPLRYRRHQHLHRPLLSVLATVPTTPRSTTAY